MAKTAKTAKSGLCGRIRKQCSSKTLMKRCKFITCNFAYIATILCVFFVGKHLHELKSGPEETEEMNLLQTHLQLAQHTVSMPWILQQDGASGDLVQHGPANLALNLAESKNQKDGGTEWCSVPLTPVTMNNKGYPNENSWAISKWGEDICVGGPYAWGDSYKPSTKLCCLEQWNLYMVKCKCSYGDGWHGGSLTIAGVDYCTNFYGHEFNTFFELDQAPGLPPTTTGLPPTTTTTTTTPNCANTTGTEAVYDGNSTGWYCPTTTTTTTTSTIPAPTGGGATGACTMTSVTMNNKAYGNENTWEITWEREGFGTPGNACSGGPYNGQNYQSSTTSCCLEPYVEYTVACKCSYGDGWHGGSLTIDGVNYCTGFNSGSRISSTLTVTTTTTTTVCAVSAVTMKNAAFGNENTWAITGPGGSEVCSGGPYNGQNYNAVSESCCLLAGVTYSVNCKCSYGDGWHGGSLEIGGVGYCTNFYSGGLYVDVVTLSGSSGPPALPGPPPAASDGNSTDDGNSTGSSLLENGATTKLAVAVTTKKLSKISDPPKVKPALDELAEKVKTLEKEVKSTKATLRRLRGLSR